MLANSPIPTIVNAINNVAGVRITQIPVTPKWCFARKIKMLKTTPDTSNAISYAVREIFNFGTESIMP